MKLTHRVKIRQTLYPNDSGSRLSCIRLVSAAFFLPCSHLSTLRCFIELKTVWYIESGGSINYNCAVKSRRQSYQGRAARRSITVRQASRREETGLAVNSEAAHNWNW